MPTRLQPLRQRTVLSGVVASMVALAIFVVLPLAAFSAPGEQQAATATPARTQTAKPAAASPTATRAGKPMTGLVLVPLSVREAGPTPGNAADLTAIRGTVVDYNGVGLWGQVVKITRGSAVQTATTNDAGFYEIDGLPAGTYSVVVDGQICTPVENVKPPIGGGLEVNFGQMRPAATAVLTTRTPLAAAPTATRTVVAAAAATATPSPTLAPTATPIGLSRWWSWIGIEIDASTLLSALFLGVMGGALFVVVGIVVGLIRR